MPFAALKVGYQARQRGFVLVRNSGDYHLWSARHGRYAVMHAPLHQIVEFLEAKASPLTTVPTATSPQHRTVEPGGPTPHEANAMMQKAEERITRHKRLALTGRDLDMLQERHQETRAREAEGWRRLQAQGIIEQQAERARWKGQLAATENAARQNTAKPKIKREPL